MAYKPSLRRSTEFEEGKLEIRPVMNLMVCLVPLLLAGAQWTKLGMKELNLPPKSAGLGSAQSSEFNKPLEMEKRLGLNVIISKQGFYIGSASGFLLTEAQGRQEGVAPSVPLNADGTMNYTGLQEKLVEIKKKVQATDFVDKSAIMITAEADIAYKYIIKTMDNVLLYTDPEGNFQELFPQIIIGQVVL